MTIYEITYGNGDKLIINSFDELFRFFQELDNNDELYNKFNPMRVIEKEV